jgi:SAM-dependent methyltransferase
MRPEQIVVNPDELRSFFVAKYAPIQSAGPNVRLWDRLGYLTPNEHYEALVDKLVTSSTIWLDVGCGRSVFPNNLQLSRQLADRCKLLVGIDPDAGVLRNEFVHDRVQTTIENFETDQLFDLITMRMVAEHITQPSLVTQALARLVQPGGVIVIFTPYRWSPLSIAARLTPHRLHHRMKFLLWRTHEEDTFPVSYQLNTRRQLNHYFLPHGFTEIHFQNVADCCTFWRFHRMHRIELATWRFFSKIGLNYPENCILAAYRRSSE